jgi:hypothetical protein
LFSSQAFAPAGFVKNHLARTFFKSPYQQSSSIKLVAIFLVSVCCCQAEPVYPELVEGKPLVVASLLFQTIMIVFVFHFFLLKEKSGAKKFKASPNRSARLAAHAQHHSASYIAFFYLSESSKCSYFYNFFESSWYGYTYV